MEKLWDQAICLARGAHVKSSSRAGCVQGLVLPVRSRQLSLTRWMRLKVRSLVDHGLRILELLSRVLLLVCCGRLITASAAHRALWIAKLGSRVLRLACCVPVESASTAVHHPRIVKPRNGLVRPAPRVHFVAALDVAAVMGHTTVVQMLLGYARSVGQKLGALACEALTLESGANALHAATGAGNDHACEALLTATSAVNAKEGAAAPFESRPAAQTAPEAVRLLLEPQRSALLKHLKAGEKPASAFSAALDSIPEDQRKPALSGHSSLAPSVVAALVDDVEAIGLLISAVAAQPSPLMWAQWVGAQGVARKLLDAEATLTNADLEGLRRLGRARRLADAEGGTTCQILRADGWEALVPGAAELPETETPKWRREGLMRRMAWEPSPLGFDAELVSPSASAGGIMSFGLEAGLAIGAAAADAAGGDDEDDDPLETAACALVSILGPERFALVRFLVQREIAIGEGRAGGVLPPEQILALQAVSKYHDVHARCTKFMPLLRAALQSLPVAKGPCYRALAASPKTSIASLLADYRPGSMVTWPAATAATMDFRLAIQSLESVSVAVGAAPNASGVIFKVRRTLTAREVSSAGREVLFLGGPLRVAGLFALSGPMLTGEHLVALSSNPLASGLDRLGPWTAPLDVARRPRPLDPADAAREPLVLVLLDEEEDEEQ